MTGSSLIPDFGFLVVLAARYNLEFSRPSNLRFLWLVIPLWLAGALAWRRSRPRRLLPALILRTAVLILVVFALSGMGLRTEREREGTVVACVDVSDSMGESGRRWAKLRARELLEAAGGETRKAVMLFAEGSRLTGSPARVISTGAFDHAPPGGATDIAGAITAAALALPPEGPKRIAILSDGNETEGDSLAAAASAAKRGIRIDTFSPPERKEDPLMLKRLEIPEEVNVSEKFTIRIVAKNRSRREVVARLLLEDGEKTVSGKRVALRPGTNVYEAEYRIAASGLHRIRAELKTAGGASVRDESGRSVSAPVLAVGKPKVLCVSGAAGGRDFLSQVLEASEMDVRIGGADIMPEKMEDLLAYDCVILSNVPRSSLSNEQMRLLARYVRKHGGGFLMLGGPKSFGPGGYRGTAIEKILPVEMAKSVPFTKESIVRLSLVLVIDKSGSMGFGSGGKIIAARRAAEELVKQLKPNDRVGVIPFDALPHELVPLGPIGDRKGFIIDRIRTVRAGGGTIVSEPLEKALSRMVRSEGKAKHVILLTDGRTEDLKRYPYRKLISLYREKGVSISTVGIGGDADSGFLKAVAKGTGGDYYYVKDASTLPIIVIEDTKKVLEKSGFLEDAIMPKVGAGGRMLKGIAEAQIPKLLGYVVTRAKPRAEVDLYTDIRRIKDPLLAGWRYGLGRTVAYTSDAEARWSQEMVSWRMFRKFWTQVVRWTMRKRSENRYLVRIGEERGRSYIELESLSPLAEGAEYRIVARRGNGGKEVTAALREIAPYTYRADAGDLPRNAGKVTVEKIEKGKVTDRKETAVIRRALARPGRPEDGRFGNNVALLKDIASATGGRYNPGAGELLLEPELIPTARILLDWLIPFVFLLLLADIALRKWG